VNLLSEGVLAQLEAPLVPTTIQATGAGGASLGPVSAVPHPLEITTPLGTSSAYFLSAPKLPAPMVLGMPWVRAVQKRITPAASINALTLGKVTKEVETQPLPPEFADYADVFSETKCDQLPPHRPGDCAIELQPGSVPPVRHQIALSLRERGILKEYIDDMTRKGFIAPSKSPASAPIFFVAKADGSLRPCVDYRGLMPSQLRTSTRSLALTSYLRLSRGQPSSPRSTSVPPTTCSESAQVTNGRPPSPVATGTLSTASWVSDW
jgi:hypothetical protein